MAHQQLLQVAAGRDPSYAEQASSLDRYLLRVSHANAILPYCWADSMLPLLTAILWLSTSAWQIVP